MGKQGCVTLPPSRLFWSRPPCGVLGPLCSGCCSAISLCGGRSRRGLCRGSSQKLLSSWQYVDSQAKAMCKSPIKSLSCSPPSSNGPHKIIYEAQVGKTSSTTQSHKAQRLLVAPPAPHGPQAGTLTCFQVLTQRGCCTSGKPFWQGLSITASE